MSNDFGYGDPYQAAAGVQQQPVAGQPPWSTAPVPAVGPLGGIQYQVASVLTGADPRHPYMAFGDNVIPVPGFARRSSVLRDEAIGGAAGFAGWLVWKRMQHRRASKGEWTSPGFRALFLLLLPPAIAFCLSMIWVPETDKFRGGGLLTGLVLAGIYTLFRTAGGGRYNTRRRGSPWRPDHQQGGHRGR